MTLGLAEHQGNLFDEVARFCEAELPATSIYALLHRERDNLFPDEFFADLFSVHGRRSVPPSVVATVMVLQRLEGLSDRDAVERNVSRGCCRFYQLSSVGATIRGASPPDPLGKRAFAALRPGSAHE
jgi:hypothetical protein